MIEPSFYITMRQSPDWKTQTYADLEKTRALCMAICRPDDFIIRAVRLWDETFGISLFETRQKMKEITLANMRDLNGAQIVTLNIRQRFFKPGVYVFTDDDDWLHPGIYNILWKDGLGGHDVFQWGLAAYRGDMKLYDRPEWSTNNYAVTSDFLNRKAKNLVRVFQHWRAGSTFKRQRRSLRIARFPQKFLCVTHKHPATIIRMQSLFRQEYSSAVLIGLVEDYVESMGRSEMPDNMNWTSPYVDRANRFFIRLLESVQG